MKNKSVTVLLTERQHYRLKYISLYNNRTMSGQIRYLIMKAVAEFEAEHGKINLPE